ncbi:MAG: hypothetical protein Kow0042_30260 [Calditrichia bacterium]
MVLGIYPGINRMPMFQKGNIMTRYLYILLYGLLFTLFLLPNEGTIAQVQGQKISPQQGVYEYIVSEAALNFEECTAELEKALLEGKFLLVAEAEAASPENCSYRSKVFTVFDSSYADEVY